ncbi:hypothetical protein OAP43_03950 [Candidatus Pseudothioglobus singularis]|nr:hypothetical protein [Candidatus Pseudothioglobus singularis]
MFLFFLRSVRKALLHPYNVYKFGVPLYCKFDDTKKVSTFLDVLEGIKSVAIIGRGASIYECNPINIIKEVDFVIILNRVDIENMTKYIGNRVDAQIAQPPPPYAVIPKKIINLFGVKYISSNKRSSSQKFKRFYRSCSNRGIEILRYPEDQELGYSFTKYSAFAPTQCGSLIKILFNVKSVEKIFFAGVDFFTQGYSNIEDLGEMVAEKQPPINNYELKGKPLINYITTNLAHVNKDRELKLYFPHILKSNFRGLQDKYIKFYNEVKIE